MKLGEWSDQPQNIMMASNDNGTCVMDSKYGDKLEFIMQRLDKLVSLEILARDVGELRTKILPWINRVYEKGECQLTENYSETEGGSSTAKSRERNIDQERFLDTEWRSMRDNLLFLGVPEGKDESSVESTLRGFMSKEMKIDGDKYAFFRVHRMGMEVADNV